MSSKKCQKCNCPGNKCKCRILFKVSEEEQRNIDNLAYVLKQTELRLQRECFSKYIEEFKRDVKKLSQEFKLKCLNEISKSDLDHLQSFKESIGIVNTCLKKELFDDFIYNMIPEGIEEFCVKINEEFKEEAEQNYRENDTQQKYYRTEEGKNAQRRGRYIRDKRFRNACRDLSEEEKELMRVFYGNCPEGYEVDHIIPLSKGGKHCMDNLQYLTRVENRRKSNKMTSLSGIFCED